MELAVESSFGVLVPAAEGREGSFSNVHKVVYVILRQA